MIDRLILLLLLIPSLGWAQSSAVAPISRTMLPGSITFIGETHKHPESIKLIEELVKVSVDHHQCLIIGLEIDDKQKPNIDAVMKGTGSASLIKIPEAIDHPALRQLITDIAALDAQSGCLQLLAIDTGFDTEYERDDWMAKRLSELPATKPILVLVGNLHTLKKVDWKIASGKPAVAEILSQKSLSVRSYPQRWIKEKCPQHQLRKSRYVGANKPEATKILNSTIISLMNAKPAKSAQGVVDGFVLWECSKDL